MAAARYIGCMERKWLRPVGIGLVAVTMMAFFASALGDAGGEKRTALFGPNLRERAVSGGLLGPELLGLLKNYHYKIYTEPYRLNIVAIRNRQKQVNTFSDRVYVFYFTPAGAMVVHNYAMTTDPGTYWLLDPRNVHGTAIVVPGQYVDAWEQGLHNGQPALRQSGPIRVYRDNTRDNVLDYLPNTIIRGTYGINMHRAGKLSTKVDKWSAGCQVWANEQEFEQFLQLAEQQVRQTGHRKFTYTLLEV